jgi:hypothetical protein
MEVSGCHQAESGRRKRQIEKVQCIHCPPHISIRPPPRPPPPMQSSLLINLVLNKITHPLLHFQNHVARDQSSDGPQTNVQRVVLSFLAAHSLGRLSPPSNP